MRKSRFFLICPRASGLTSEAGLDLGIAGWTFYIGVKCPSEGTVNPDSRSHWLRARKLLIFVQSIRGFSVR